MLTFADSGSIGLYNNAVIACREVAPGVVGHHIDGSLLNWNHLIGSSLSFFDNDFLAEEIFKLGFELR